LREATEAAVLNARYVGHHLTEAYDKPFASDSMHEVIFSHKKQSRKGVHTLDIAKRLIDYGFHPMTIYFPLIVEGAMLIEPTESVGRADLDAFIDSDEINRRRSRPKSRFSHRRAAYDQNRQTRRSDCCQKTRFCAGNRIWKRRQNRLSFCQRNFNWENEN
jgi:glycine cleavage system protein P-like pyridoxal-binding family